MEYHDHSGVNDVSSQTGRAKDWSLAPKDAPGPRAAVINCLAERIVRSC
jgi:hypothetical protein